MNRRSFSLSCSLALPFVCSLPASAESSPTASSPVVEDLFSLQWYTLAVLAVLIIAGVVLYLSARKVRWNSRRIANAAMCIAIAYVLSCIKLFRAPQGGSITPASTLPLIAFSLACGPLQGFIAGCAYGLLGLIQDPFVIHPLQMLIDYPLASGALALGGLASFLPVRKELQLPIAVLLGNIGRYLMAVLSGTVFFAEYAPAGQSALIYSIVYNLSYIGPDVLFCLLFSALPGIYRIVPVIRGNAASSR